MNPISIRIPEHQMRYSLHLLLCVFSGLLLLAATARTQTITFTTAPYDPSTSTGAKVPVGTSYTYDAEANASNGGAVRYSLRYGPDGMTVDPTTGLVSWRPQKVGTYLAEIRAQLAANPTVSATQSWAILVTECDEYSIIHGTVKDQDGNLVTSGTVTAQVVGPNRTPLAKVRTSIENGKYEMAVDKGTYVLYLEGTDLIPEWYGDAYTFATATRITTTCQSTTTADWQVYRIPATSSETIEVTIEGHIIDANQQMPNRNITFLLSYFPAWLWESTEEQWKLKFSLGFDAFSRKESAIPSYPPYKGTGKVTAFENGIYGVRADQEKSYYFMTTLVYNIQGGGGWNDNAGRQFFDLTPNPVEAIPLTADRDTTFRDINFAVSAPDSLHDILFRIESEDTTDERALRILYAIDSLPNGGYRIDWARSKNGSGMINRGKYIVFVIPQNQKYAPGFFVANDTVALEITDASIIDADTITFEGQWGNPFIPTYLRPRTNGNGVSDVRGVVNGIPNRTEQKGNAPQGSLPMVGAFVYALDSMNQVISYTFTNDDGTYVLKGLGEGTSTVHASKVGYEMVDPQTLVVSGTGEIVEANFWLNGNNPSAVPEEISRELRQSAATVHPNPAKEEIVLDFEGASGTAQLSIISTTGKEVMRKEITTTSGRNSLQLDVNSLANGVYVIRVTGDDYQASSRFTVTR